MGLGKTLGRVGLGIATMGGSEIGRGIDKISNSGVPEAKTIDFDPGTKELMAAKEAQAAETPEQAADRLTKGLDAQQSSFSAATPFQNKGLMQVDPYSQALSSRLGRKMGDEFALMKSRARQAAPEQALQASQVAGQGARAKAQMAMSGYVNKLNAIAARKNARAQLMGSVMQIGGTIGGAAIAGPSGAAKGNQVAQGVSPQQQSYISNNQNQPSLGNYHDFSGGK